MGVRGGGEGGGLTRQHDGRPVYPEILREIYEILLKSRKCPVKLRDAFPCKLEGLISEVFFSILHWVGRR